MRKDGYWSGYNSYRHGEERKQEPKRSLTGDRLRHVVHQAIDIMNDWRSSPFENEASIRHGLRTALCLDGHGWADADHDAATVAAMAFATMGAKRPTWEQGQRQYVIAQEDCNWCGCEIPDTDREGVRKARFCSSSCAKSAILHRDYETTRRESAVLRSAVSILNREALPTRQCEHCEAQYRPFSAETKDQRFCSIACARASARTIPETECPTCLTVFRPRLAGRRFCSHECAMSRPLEPRPCTVCTETFMPKTEQALFCSQSCTMRSFRMKRAKRTGKAYKPAGSTFDGNCQHCRQPFLAQSPKAIYCGPRCVKAAYTARKRESNVHYLTTEIFDSWFREAA